MHGSGGTVSPSGGSITTGPACNLNRGGPQASFRSTVSDTEVETLQVSTCTRYATAAACHTQFCVIFFKIIACS